MALVGKRRDPVRAREEDGAWLGGCMARRGGLREQATEATRGGRLGGEIVGKVGFWLSVVPWGVVLMSLTGDSG